MLHIMVGYVPSLSSEGGDNNSSIPFRANNIPIITNKIIINSTNANVITCVIFASLIK